MGRKWHKKVSYILMMPAARGSYASRVAERVKPRKALCGVSVFLPPKITRRATELHTF